MSFLSLQIHSFLIPNQKMLQNSLGEFSPLAQAHQAVHEPEMLRLVAVGDLKITPPRLIDPNSMNFSGFKMLVFSGGFKSKNPSILKT